MRIFCAWIAASTLALTGCAHVQEKPAETSAPPLVSNERQGYAFEIPRVLAEQRLFGIAHGVALLAGACHDDAAATTAYTQWHERESASLDTIKNELAAFYYGPRASEATWADIAGALKLRTRLDIAPERLQEACASLPQALQLPRYDFAARLRLETALAQNVLAVRVETQHEVCATRLPASARPALAEHYAAWQSRQGEALADARARLTEEWKLNGMSGEVDDVFKALHHQYSNPPQATCEKLADWLGTPAANIEQAFAPAPPPTSMPAAEPGKDNAAAPVNTEAAESWKPSMQMPQTPAEIDATTQAAPSAEKAEDKPQPNIFDQAIDHILNFFKTPANEQQRPNE